MRNAGKAEGSDGQEGERQKQEEESERQRKTKPHTPFLTWEGFQIQKLEEHWGRKRKITRFVFLRVLKKESSPHRFRKDSEEKE